MTKPKFSKLVKCGKCLSNMKSKKERNVRKYLCSNYDHYKKCIRMPIEEDYLNLLIKRKFGREFNADEIKEKINEIVVYERYVFKDERGKRRVSYKLEIKFYDEEPIIEGEKYWQYL